MVKRELKKSTGDIFCEASRSFGNTHIQLNWIGIQSLETIMMGANLVLNLLREDPCPAILNSNQELIGPWDEGAAFLGRRWAPQAHQLGVQYFAQILGPGRYGQRSFKTFRELAEPYFHIETFATEKEALAWLLD